MNYVVVWNPRATNRIDAAWQAGDPVARSELEAAVVEAERLLSAAPMELGESRDALEKRVMILPPVTFFYRVDNTNRIVRVVAACVYRPD